MWKLVLVCAMLAGCATPNSYTIKVHDATDTCIIPGHPVELQPAPWENDTDALMRTREPDCLLLGPRSLARGGEIIIDGKRVF